MLWVRQGFLRFVLKRTTDKVNFIKTSNSCSSKDTIKKMNRLRENICNSHYLTMNLHPDLWSTLRTLGKPNLKKKMREGLNRYLTKDNIQLANKWKDVQYHGSLGRCKSKSQCSHLPQWLKQYSQQQLRARTWSDGTLADRWWEQNGTTIWPQVGSFL